MKNVFLFMNFLLFCSAFLSFNRVSAEKLRTYYIGAVKESWDYAPSGYNLINKTLLSADPDAKNFTVADEEHIGRIYIKARYVEFTDETFTKRKIDVDPVYKTKYDHLGLLGPVIYAEVGDQVRVVFKNLTPKQENIPFSIHVHGLKYDKNSEGALYADGTNPENKKDDAVYPGETYIYNYVADIQAGPGPMDPDSIVWMYHSHTSEIKDTYSGLIGPIVVTAKGKAKDDGSPKSIDREFFLLFSIFDERQSHYIKENMSNLDFEDIDQDGDEFKESTLMHSINGYLYGNLSGLAMSVGEKVRWYVLDLGTEIDIHTPHWHGETVMFSGMRMDMLELLPGSMKVADMEPKNPGTWLFHCHVNDHLASGMSTLFTVLLQPITVKAK